MENATFAERFFSQENCLSEIREQLESLGIDFTDGKTIGLPEYSQRKRIPYLELRDTGGNLILVLRADGKEFIVHQPEKTRGQISDALTNNGFTQIYTERVWDKQYLQILERGEGKELELPANEPPLANPV